MLFAEWLLILETVLAGYADMSDADKAKETRLLSNLIDIESILDRSRGIVPGGVDISRRLEGLLDTTRSLINTFPADAYKAVVESQIRRKQQIAGLR